MGKFNIHRYMNLFKELRIYHSVLADGDANRNAHEVINQFIETNKNDYTKGIYFFDNNLENFLDIPTPSSNKEYKKPLNVMWYYMNNRISKDKITKLKEIIKGII